MCRCMQRVRDSSLIKSDNIIIDHDVVLLLKNSIPLLLIEVKKVMRLHCVVMCCRHSTFTCQHGIVPHTFVCAAAKKC